MNTEQIVLRFPNETFVDIHGDPFVVSQVVKRLDGLVISFEHKTVIGFDTVENKTS